jgi:putative intracellular protease/amidase
LARVLIPLPDRDFDVTEVATPWHRLVERGVEVVFATEAGAVAQADPLLLTGVVFGQLGAKPPARERYARMIETAAFRHPIPYAAIEPAAYDALLLPGGHAPGMKQYLESRALQEKVVGFFRLEKPVAAICHGPLVLARTLDPATGRSVVAGYTLTALPRYLELLAYALTAWKLGNYYRTYPTPVEDELRAALDGPGGFRLGPPAWVPHVERDRNLLTARWPEDAEAFAAALIAMLEACGALGRAA